MPEEINRLMLDQISKWLFTPSSDADDNLLAEGIEPSRIHLVGNVMIDTLLRLLPRTRDREGEVLQRLGCRAKAYGVVTLHRPSNVDDPSTLGDLLAALGSIAEDLPLVFALHPRTEKQMNQFGLSLPPGVLGIEPRGYLDFLALTDGSAMVLTDSGGLQEETSVLGVPCLTLRENTERPITCELGTITLVGIAPEAIVASASAALSREWASAEIPHWDGHVGERIAEILVRGLNLSV